jgi:protein gp37
VAQNSSIEWTDATWNPTRGCTKVAPGCKHCYAETFAERFRGVKDHPYEQGFDPRTAPDQLGLPLTWKRPRKIFVDSMSDLFHESFDFRYIAAVFGVMAACKWHTFQILTKRPARAAEWFSWVRRQAAVGLECAGALHPLAVVTGSANHILGIGSLPVPPGDLESWLWPLPNVWIGTSIANQDDADKNIHILRQIPAAVRFLSVEPLIGPVDASIRGIDWVIVGGESGHGARPMHPDWVRSLRDQCVAAKVPFFFKQWGEWAPFPAETAAREALPQNSPVCLVKPDGRVIRPYCGLDAPGAEMVHLGKKKAGRLLDGRTWDEFPEMSA